MSIRNSFVNTNLMRFFRAKARFNLAVCTPGLKSGVIQIMNKPNQ